ncbi:TIM barrel protein [Paracoccus sp. p4-l81]|uniref:TIM barrel protein n=1 Tax=Paracoccus sp. p4-l81 TaxID=3342806 RepID=UPI0035BB3B14
MRFALNHICAPRLALPDFMAMCARLGVHEIEIRNDLPDVLGSLRAADVAAMAADHDVTILAINALYPFNMWSGDLPDRAEAMADYAARAGARGLVMCPLNDGRAVEHSAVVAALDAMRPLLSARGLLGYVEPLGFPVSSLRRKADAIAAITEAGGFGTFQLLHDSFHHHLAGEDQVYAQRTGLVHLSGVTDPALAVDAMLDAHRVLVDGDDRLGNVAQARALIAGGYDGPFSLEPFAPAVHARDDIEDALRATMDHIRAGVSAP